MVDFSLWDILRNLLMALRWTVVLSLIAFIGGGLVGGLLLFLRLRGGSVMNRAVGLYVQLFQGTPLLMQLFLAYFGIALFGVDVSAWTAASVALTLYTSAFLTEIWRGCVASIPKGQWEASGSLALSFAEQMRHVILPQAVKIAIAPTVGFLVQVIKGTALASVIGFVELTKAGSMISNATFQPFVVFSCVALLYFRAVLPGKPVRQEPREEIPWPPCLNPQTSAAPIVRVTALRKSYGANEVLKGIDLEVKRGEVIAIIGKSGSGKSTLLRCINGLEVFQEGSLTVDGKPLLHESAMAMRELRQRVGMIFQSFNLFPHLTVGKNVMLAPTLVKKRSSLEAASQARKLLDRVGLGRKIRRHARPAFRRPAAARGHCTRAGDGAGGVAVRRDHLRARPRTGRRRAARSGVAGRRGHDAPDGHARDELCTQGERPLDLHAPGPRA